MFPFICVVNSANFLCIHFHVFFYSYFLTVSYNNLNAREWASRSELARVPLGDAPYII